MALSGHPQHRLIAWRSYGINRGTVSNEVTQSAGADPAIDLNLFSEKISDFKLFFAGKTLLHRTISQLFPKNPVQRQHVNTVR